MLTILGRFSPRVSLTDQLRASLSATYLEEPLLWASVIMDLHQLRTNIKTAQSTDSTCINGLTKANDGISNWTIDDDGLLQQNNHLWIPDALDLQLQILQHHHDHIISGHFRKLFMTFSQGMASEQRKTREAVEKMTQAIEKMSVSLGKMTQVMLTQHQAIYIPQAKMLRKC